MNHQQNTEYLEQLAAQLTDLHATVKHGHLCIGDMRVWTEVRKSEEVVCVRTGYARHGRRSPQRTFKRIEADYIVEQLRRIVRERAEKDAAAHARQQQILAMLQREAAVAAPLNETAKLVNDASTAAGRGRLVTNVEVSEYTKGADGEPLYLVSLDVQCITVAMAAAIMTLVAADQPWLCQHRMGGFRCGLAAGHRGPHDHLKGWSGAATDATQGRVCASCGESPCLDSCGACDYEAPSGER